MKKIIAIITLALASFVGLATSPTHVHATATDWGATQWTPYQSASTVLSSDGQAQWIASGCTYTYVTNITGIEARATFYCSSFRPGYSGDDYISASQAQIKITCTSSGAFNTSGIAWTPLGGPMVGGAWSFDYTAAHCTSHTFTVTAQIGWKVWV
jgi:hypothetical protein